MIFVELHFPRGKVQQKKNLIRNPFFTRHETFLTPYLMTTFNCFFSIFTSPSKVQLIGSLCSENMKDAEDMEFWLSILGTQPPLAQPSSLPPLSLLLSLLLSHPPPALPPPAVDLFLLPGNRSAGNVTQDCLLQLQRNKQEGENSRCYIRTVMYKCTKAR